MDMANTSARGPEGLPDASAAGQPGRIGSVTLPTNGPLSTITALDPTADKPDPSSCSDHNLIVEDRAEGLAFTDPGSGRAVPIEGVSLGRLTVDSFVPVKNHHLRMGLSGTLAWEQDQEAAPHTAYARSRKAGQLDRVTFDPATDLGDCRTYGSREQLFTMDRTGGSVIGDPATGQPLVPRHMKMAELSAGTFLFTGSQAREDQVWSQLGLTALPETQVIAHRTIATGRWPTAAGTGAPPSGDAAHATAGSD